MSRCSPPNFLSSAAPTNLCYVWRVRRQDSGTPVVQRALSTRPSNANNDATTSIVNCVWQRVHQIILQNNKCWLRRACWGVAQPTPIHSDFRALLISQPAPDDAHCALSHSGQVQHVRINNAQPNNTSIVKLTTTAASMSTAAPPCNATRLCITTVRNSPSLSQGIAAVISTTLCMLCSNEVTTLCFNSLRPPKHECIGICALANSATERTNMIPA